MNLKIEKKEYEAPKMTVVDMEVETNLLAFSGEDGEVGSDDPENPYYTN